LFLPLAFFHGRSKCKSIAAGHRDRMQEYSQPIVPTHASLRYACRPMLLGHAFFGVFLTREFHAPIGHDVGTTLSHDRFLGFVCCARSHLGFALHFACCPTSHLGFALRFACCSTTHLGFTLCFCLLFNESFRKLSATATWLCAIRCPALAVLFAWNCSCCGVILVDLFLSLVRIVAGVHMREYCDMVELLQWPCVVPAAAGARYACVRGQPPWWTRHSPRPRACGCGGLRRRWLLPSLTGA
jgi:hypothetical protein